MSHRILGTSPVSSELDIPNETDIPRVPLTASPTHLSWVARCPADTTIAWLQPSRGTKLVPNGDGPKTYWLSRLPPFTRPKATAARSLPSLVNTHKASPPVDRIKACPHRQLWLHEKKLGSVALGQRSD